MKIVLALCLSIVVLALVGSVERLRGHYIVSTTGNAIRAGHIAPHDYKILFMKSVVEMRGERCDLAIDTLNQVIAIAPYFWDARNNLGICYAAMGAPNHAKAIWQEILKEWPWHKEASANLQEIDRQRSE